jgi:hypothetical protein
LSYYLTGKALDFYEQVAIRKPLTYGLEEFFLDLFDFCFPKDFRNKMRDQLNRCYQNSKLVLEHIAAFEQLWRVVGLPNVQEKVVKFWRCHSEYQHSARIIQERPQPRDIVVGGSFQRRRAR